MSETDGLQGIARDLVGAAAARVDQAADGEQLSLLDLVPSSRGSREQFAAEIVDQAKPRGRGRPLGAENLATRQVKAMVARLFGDPLLESARWLLHTPRSMAQELGCTVLEAWDRQQRVREALLPFMHSRMAPVGEDGRAVVPSFNLVIGGAGAGADMAPWLSDPEIAAAMALADETEQNQELSASAPGVVARDLSHGAAK